MMFTTGVNVCNDTKEPCVHATVCGNCCMSTCTNKPRSMTNADRIRAMSDEELAEFLLYDIDRDEFGTTLINKTLIFTKTDMLELLQREWMEEDA